MSGCCSRLLCGLLVFVSHLLISVNDSGMAWMSRDISHLGGVPAALLCEHQLSTVHLGSCFHRASIDIAEMTPGDTRQAAAATAFHPTDQSISHKCGLPPCTTGSRASKHIERDMLSSLHLVTLTERLITHLSAA
jgi:hypothetical protein